MKKLFSLICTILVFSFANAQEVYKVKPGHVLPQDKSTPEMYRYYKSPGMQDPLFLRPLDRSYNYQDAITFEPKANLLYRTEKGSVYALPLDDMPCLRPDIHSDMPVARLTPNGYIPNALQIDPKFHGEINGVKIIPGKK